MNVTGLQSFMAVLHTTTQSQIVCSLSLKSQPLMAKQFQRATTEAEWFNLLGLVLTGMPEIYIIIDIGVLREDFANGKAWPSMFIGSIQKLLLQSPKTIVKVAIVFHLAGNAGFVKLDQRSRPNKLALDRSSTLQIRNDGRRRG